MKKLNELFKCDYETEVYGIKINSKEIEPGDLFVCTTGVTADRHEFVPDAIARGAVAIVASKKIDSKVPVVYVEDTNKELPLLCARFYDNPDKKLKIIGITGTDGKTSTSTIIQTLIGKDVCGYIGTNGRSCAKFDKDTNRAIIPAQGQFEKVGSWQSLVNEAIFIEKQGGKRKVYIKSEKHPARTTNVEYLNQQEVCFPIDEFDINAYLDKLLQQEELASEAEL